MKKEEEFKYSDKCIVKAFEEFWPVTAAPCDQPVKGN